MRLEDNIFMIGIYLGKSFNGRNKFSISLYINVTDKDVAAVGLSTKHTIEQLQLRQ
jgi:hypothetical protein